MKSKELGQVPPKRNGVSEPCEVYTAERIAEFLLGSATDEESYRDAEAEVLRMGLDPRAIDHFKPDVRSH